MSSKRRHNLTSKKRAGGGPGQFTLSSPDALTKAQRARLVRADGDGAETQETDATSGTTWVLLAIAAALALWAIFWPCPPK